MSETCKSCGANEVGEICEVYYFKKDADRDLTNWASGALAALEPWWKG